MKKLLYIPLLAIGLILTTQTTADAQIGVRGGVNFATVTGDDVDADTRTGLMVGLYTNYALGNGSIILQPEVLYTQKGFETTQSFGELGDADVTFKLDYIEVPILAKVNFAGNESFAPHVYAGPYIAFKVNATAESNGDEGDVDGVESTDFGLVLGAGVDIGALNIGARYGLGLTEIGETGDAKNSVFSIVAGFSI